MALCQGSRAQMVTFFVFTYIWQEDVAKISKALKALHHVNPARANNRVRKRNHHSILYHFSITINLHLASFSRQNTLKKNQQVK